MWVVPLVAAFALSLWLIPEESSDRDVQEGGGVPVGTSGMPGSGLNPAPDDARPAPDAAAHESAGVLTELETITGAIDGNELVGRRVDLHVDVQNRANDVAFWVGSRDNRILVVMARDNRSGRQRQLGVGAGHNIVPVHDGQRATISGVIRRLPDAQAMASWGLTVAEKSELTDRKIYIRADHVSSEGHGTF
jgi:hypothetical protein